MEKVLTRLPKLVPHLLTTKGKDAPSSCVTSTQHNSNDSTAVAKGNNENCSSSSKMTQKLVDASSSSAQSRNLKARGILRKSLMSPDGCQSLEKINKKVMTTRSAQRSSSLGSSSTTSSSVTNTNNSSSSTGKFLSVFCSPVVSNNNNSTGRISLQKLSSEKKAKRVKFYRNGDKYFKGVSYSIMNEKFRNFDSLLDDLNNVLIDQVCTVSSSIS